jgi:hypothetical protein
MDKDKKCCSMLDVVKYKKSQVFGLFLLVLATLLTFFSYEGLGILGMFLVGLCLFKGHVWGCKCNCGCCNKSHHDSCCAIGECDDIKVEAKAKPKAKPKAK